MYNLKNKFNKKNNIKLYFRKKKDTAGFTIVEALVSIAILVTSITTPILIASQGVSATITAKGQMIATYLAQDALEFVRYRFATNNNLRQSDPSGGHELMDNLGDCIFPLHCRVDTYKDEVSSCGGNCSNLKKDSTTDLFGYDGAYEDTQFKRELTIVVDGDEYQVITTTTFGKKDERHSVIVKDLLLDWRPAY